MTVLYSIHAYDTNYMCHQGDDKINTGILYTTFEKACDAIEKKIDFYIEYWNNHESSSPEEFEPPNREEMKKKMEVCIELKYYKCHSAWIWVIRKWEVCE